MVSWLQRTFHCHIWCRCTENGHPPAVNHNGMTGKLVNPRWGAGQSYYQHVEFNMYCVIFYKLWKGRWYCQHQKTSRSLLRCGRNKVFKIGKINRILESFLSLFAIYLERINDLYSQNNFMERIYNFSNVHLFTILTSLYLRPVCFRLATSGHEYQF